MAEPSLAPLPRGKFVDTKVDSSANSKNRTKNVSKKRQVNSFFDEWLQGRKKIRSHHPFSIDEKEATDQFQEYSEILEEPAVLNKLPSQGAGLEKTAMLGVVQSVNVRTGRINLISWNHIKVFSNEWNELSQYSVTSQQEAEEQTENQDEDLIVKPGMILPFSVLSVTKQGTYRNIQVSILPSNVNRHIDPWFLTKGCLVYGIVYEKEEYGFRVSFGFDSIPLDGFLPFEETDSLTIKLGSLIWCVITQVKRLDKRGIARVSTDRRLVCSSKISQQSNWPFGCVFPGLRMEGKVLQKFKGKSWTSIQLASDMKGFVYSLNKLKHSSLDLRVTFVDFERKQIYLSAVECLVENLESPKLPNDWKLGSMLDNIVVKGHLSNPKGVLLRHVESSTNLFAPISQLSDSEETKKKNNNITLPPLESIVRCRIIGFSPIDATILVSCKSSTLSKSVVSFDELYPGKQVHCKIESIRENGCLCIVEDNIRAWIPRLHFGDTVGTRLVKKFVPGKQVIGCVLSIFRDSHRCTITTKKKFLDRKYPVIASIQDAKNHIGSSVYCCVYQVSSSRGLQVEFFQGVKGFLPVSYMNLETSPSIDWLEQNYPVGKTLKVWILSVHEESHRIVVSLSKDILELNNGNAMVVHEALLVGVEYGKLIVEVFLDSKKRALLPKEHLSDFPSLSEKIYSLLVSYFESCSSSLPLKQVVILRSRISSEDCRALVSLKRSLIEFALAYPWFPNDDVFNEWKANQMLPGFVERETLHKYLIGFTGNWKVWMDKNEWNLNRKLLLRTPRIHETVWCHLLVDNNHVEPKVSLVTQWDSSELPKMERKYSFYPTRYFDDVEQWKSQLVQWNLMKESVLAKKDLFKQGEIVAAQLVSKRSSEHVFSLKEGNVSGEQVIGISVSEEQVSKDTYVRILEYDSLSGFFLVYPVNDAKSHSEVCKLPSPKSLLQGIVVLIKEEYLIMRIPEWNDLLVYLTFWDPRVRMNLSAVYSVGSVAKGIVCHSEQGFVVLVANGERNKKRNDMVSTLNIGDQVVGNIVRISPVHLHLSVPQYSCYGRIHLSQLRSELEEHYEVGQQLQARIIAKSYSKSLELLELTLKEDMEDAQKLFVDWRDLSCRQRVTGFVSKILPYEVLISFSSKVIGVMKPWGFTNDEQLLSSKDIFSSWRIGQPVDCTIVRLKASRKLLEVALSELVKPVRVGDSIVAQIKQLYHGVEFSLQLPKWVKWSLLTCRGVLYLTDVDDDFDRAIAKVAQLKSGQWIKAAIIDCVTLQDKLVVVLSLRDSDVNVAQGAPKDIRWTKMEDLKPGQLVRGFIRHHSSKGCFVQLAYNIVGRVMLRNLSDGFIQNVEETFPVGHLVTAKVINVENGQVELSLRESDLADRETIYSMLQSGLCLQGTVKNIQPFGIFVSLGLGITGLCHISTLEKENKYQIGECIWVQVSGVDKEKRRISLLPLDPMKVNERIRTLAEIVGISFHKDSAQHSSMYKQVDLKDSSSDDDSEFEEPQEEVLRVPENFRLEEDEFLSENQHNAGNSDDRSMMENSKTEQQSMEEYLDEEKELEFSLDEPQTEEDFERNILASPDDSSIWIRYMAYFVSKRQIQRAKETARRALEKISVRKQDEKLNVWIAYLNLEAQYGDENHLSTILDEACSRTNAEKLLLRFAKSMQKTHMKKAEEIYLRACRQLKQSPEVWMQTGSFYYERQNNISAGRKTLERALLSLPKQEHIRVITKFTILEYKFGSIERARTIFENMISSFPKRLDIWNVYLDMEWKQVNTEEDKERLRRLFERACALSLSSKKMKFLFKKYLEFEKTIGGNPERVKTLAKQYVEKQL